MSKHSEEQVDHIAKLSRIRLKPAEKAKLAKNFSEIVQFVDALQKVKDKEAATIRKPLLNVTRKDEPVDRKLQKAILDNAPKREGSYIKVKKVLSEDL